jgi:hypothetical protein
VASSAAFVPWLLASVAWMPVFGWFGSGLGLAGVIAARLVIAIGAAAWGCLLLWSAGEAGIA